MLLERGEGPFVVLQQLAHLRQDRRHVFLGRPLPLAGQQCHRVISTPLMPPTWGALSGGVVLHDVLRGRRDSARGRRGRRGPRRHFHAVAAVLLERGEGPFVVPQQLAHLRQDRRHVILGRPLILAGQQHHRVIGTPLMPYTWGALSGGVVLHDVLRGRRDSARGRRGRRGPLHHFHAVAAVLLERGEGLFVVLQQLAHLRQDRRHVILGRPLPLAGQQCHRGISFASMWRVLRGGVVLHDVLRGRRDSARGGRGGRGGRRV